MSNSHRSETLSESFASSESTIRLICVCISARFLFKQASCFRASERSKNASAAVWRCASLPVIFTLLFFGAIAQSEELTGTAYVLDGDTIEIARKRIRLEGIDAPEPRQDCEQSWGAKYPCGYEATRALRQKIAGRKIACKVSGRDRYSRTLAICYLDTTDLNRWLVQRGHAVANRR